jgi:hypothetical protein
MDNISLKEFIDKGYFQELNRKFLHPLGLSLIIEINDKGEYILSHIKDYRESGGVFFNISDMSEEKKEEFRNKKINIEKELANMTKKRKKVLGFKIEEI